MTSTPTFPDALREALGLRSIRVATRPRDRMRGLLGTKALPPGEGLLLDPCSAVHTCGMAFPLDLIFLDRRGRITRLVRNVPPGRLCVWGGWRARRVLEAAAGWLPDPPAAFRAP